MVKLMGSEIETDIGSSNGILDGNEYDKLGGSSLAQSLVEEGVFQTFSCYEMLDENKDENIEG